MTQYNINFNVKYYEIEQELLEKVVNGEMEYSIEDIKVVCDKLYTDELINVFYSENILDDKIDEGIKYILEVMFKNSDFIKLTNEIKELLMFNKASDTNDTYDYNSNYIVILATFSFPVFWIMHKCICQQLTNENIDNNLLVMLKEQLIKYISNNSK